MPPISFLVLSVLLLAGGFLSALHPSRFLKPSLFLILVWPSGWVLISSVRWQGIYAQDAFYAGLIIGLGLIFGAGFGEAIRKRISGLGLALLALILLFLVLHRNGNFQWRAFLLELRFVIVAAQILLLLGVVSLNRWSLSERRSFLEKVLIANGLIDLAMFGWRAASSGVAGVMPRYYDASTILAVYYLCFLWKPNIRRLKLADIGALLSLLISGTRFYLALVLIWQGKSFLSSRRSALRKTLMITGLLGTVLIIATVWGNIEVNRSITPKIIAGHVGMRYFPFVWEWISLTWTERFFGLGSGTVFFIPWFIYWGLNPWNIYMDSFYGTVIIKFGLITGPLMIILLVSALRRAGPIMQGFFPWLAVLGLTQAILWQSHFHTILLIAVLVSPGGMDQSKLSPDGAREA